MLWQYHIRALSKTGVAVGLVERVPPFFKLCLKRNQVLTIVSQRQYVCPPTIVLKLASNPDCPPWTGTTTEPVDKLPNQAMFALIHVGSPVSTENRVGGAI